MAVWDKEEARGASTASRSVQGVFEGKTAGAHELPDVVQGDSALVRWEQVKAGANRMRSAVPAVGLGYLGRRHYSVKAYCRRCVKASKI